MIITKPAIKRVTTKVSELAKAQDTTSEKLVKEIKTFVLQSVAAKGIPVNIAEEVEDSTFNSAGIYHRCT